MNTIRKNTTKAIRVLLLAFLALALTACIMEPKDDEDTGSVTLSISASAVNGSTSAADLDANRVRVWLYANGTDYDLGGAGYAEIAGAGGTVTIEDIPQGEGYSVVVVTGNVGSSGVFRPTGYAQTQKFTVVGGRETSVAATRQAIVGTGAPLTSLDYVSEGETANSVVRLDDGSNGNSAAVLATDTEVFISQNGGDFAEVALDGVTTIFSVSKGVDITQPSIETAYLNTDNGIYPFIYSGGSWVVNADSKAFAEAMIGDNGRIRNVTDSAAFVETDGTGAITATSIFFQRWGGIGLGELDSDTIADINNGTINKTRYTAWEWTDIGNSKDFDGFSETASPARAQATKGDSVGYFATSLGTFQITSEIASEENSDLSAGELLDPESDTTGLTFFGVPYPGSGRPMRIEEMGIIGGGTGEALMVGTERGAFWFPVTALGSLSATSQVTAVNAVSEVLDEKVVSISVAGAVDGYVAITTDEKLVVKTTPANIADAKTILNVPVRATVLGEPKTLFMDIVGGVPTLYVAGTEGISVLEIPAP